MKSDTFQNFILKWRPTAIIGIYLCLEFFFRLPALTELNDWCTTPFTFNYSFGLHSRYLIGSIFQLLLSPISLKRLYFFVALSILILIALYAYYMGTTLHKVNDEEKFGTAYAIVLLLASPASIAFLFYWGNFGRMDLYLLILTFVSLLCLEHKFLKNCVPLLVGIGMAIHQVFAFTYCGVILGALFYDLYQTKYSRSSIVRFALSLMIAGSFFVYFQFFASTLAFDNASEVVSYLNSQSNIPVNEKMITYEYFKDISDHIETFVMPGFKERLRLGLVTLLLISPIGIFTGLFWIEMIKSTTWRLGYLCLALIPLTSLPAFMLTIDWGRWFGAIIISSFMMIFYLIRANNTSALSFFRTLSFHIKKTPTIALLLLLYFTMLNKFGAAAILDSASALITKISWLLS